MTTDEYVPDEQDLEVAWIESEASADDINVASAEFDRFLARVRRDAAREFVDRTLLDWGIGEDEDSHLCPATANDLRAAVDVAHPEEAP